jgi:SAM-dependent methyltransferase
MSEYGSETYGDMLAEHYDDWVAAAVPDRETEAAVALLAELAGGGAALEFGIGTGRVALPLAARGVPVTGIEASRKMVEQLRAKPDGKRLPVVIGDFVDVRVPGTFTLVYIVLSTLFNLTTQEEQIRCLANAAARVGPGGRLVVEANVPDPTRFDRGQRVQATDLDNGQVRLDLSRHDPTRQTISVRHVVIGGEGITLYPVKIRYVWPSELDLMCRLAGLRLLSRAGDWSGAPFTSASPRHVSVSGADADI